MTTSEQILLDMSYKLRSTTQEEPMTRPADLQSIQGSTQAGSIQT